MSGEKEGPTIEEISQLGSGKYNKDFGGQEWGKSGDKWREPQPQFMEFMAKYKEQIGQDVLDDGCGNFRHGLPLAREGFKVTGLDRSERMLASAKQRLQENGLKANLVRGDHHDLPFANTSFDTVVSSQTFQFNNSEGARRSFAEAARVLRSNGLFFLRVRSTTRDLKKSFGDQARLLKKNDLGGEDWQVTRPDGVTTYDHQYSREEIETLALDNNLEILEEPQDERHRLPDGQVEPGQWNVVMRKRKEIERYGSLREITSRLSTRFLRGER